MGYRETLRRMAVGVWRYRSGRRLFLLVVASCAFLLMASFVDTWGLWDLFELGVFGFMIGCTVWVLWRMHDDVVRDELMCDDSDT